MNTEYAETELAEPHLRRLLGTVGLDVEYVSGEGNTLHHRAGNGSLTPSSTSPAATAP